MECAIMVVKVFFQAIIVLQEVWEARHQQRGTAVFEVMVRDRENNVTYRFSQLMPVARKVWLPHTPPIKAGTMQFSH